jgi:hypothetical protein
MWKRLLLPSIILSLSACATTTREVAAPCLQPPPPDPLLMQPPQYEQNLREILQQGQGQTSETTSSATTDKPTPR